MKSLPLYIITGVLAFVIIGQYKQAQAQEYQARHDYVYQICDHARQTIDGDDEYNCAYIQAKEHIEYLCKQRNMSNTNQCWTEDNDKLSMEDLSR